MLRVQTSSQNQRLLGVFLLIVVLTLIIAYALSRMEVYFAVAIAVVLVTLIVIFSNTDAAIILLIFSMLLSPEFGTRGTTGGGVTFRVDDLLLVMIIMVWLAKTAIYKDLHLFSRTVINKPILYYSFACFWATGLGIIAGRVQILNGFFFTLKIIQYFFIFWMVSNHLVSKKQAKMYIIAMLITFTLVVLIAIGQIPSGQRLTAPFEGKGGEPNTLGGYMVLMYSVILGFLLTKGSIEQKWLRRYLFSISVISIPPFLLTNSRSSWLAFIPLLIMFIILSEKRMYLIVALTIAIVSAPYYVPQEVKDRIAYTFKEEKGYGAQFQEKIGNITLDTSTSERIRSFFSAWDAFKEKKLFGYGITGWKFLDNQYMRVLVETGILGLSTFLFLLYSILKQSWYVYKNVKDKFFQSVALGFFTGTLALMVHSLGTNTFIIIRIMEPYWLLAAIVFASLKIEALEEEQKLKIIM